MKINKQTIEKFQKELGSKNPTPGGGVVAALSGQLAASLVEMVCNLTIGKEGYEKVQAETIRIHKNAIEIKKRLGDLAEEDSKAFQKVMESYRIDKGNLKRKEQIIKSLKYAIAVPLEVRKLTQELKILAEKTAKIGNKNTASDAKTAIYLSEAAGKAAQENVKINKDALARIK